MKVYKVVRKHGDKLYSYIPHGRGITVRYMVGEYASPKLARSKLFAFTDKCEAILWAGDSGENRVYSAIAKRATTYGSSMLSWLPERFAAFWNRAGRGMYQLSLPPHTVLCDQIKLIKEVT